MDRNLEKYREELKKAKKTFGLEPDNRTLEDEIERTIREQKKRNKGYNSQLILNTCYELFYLLDTLKDLHTPYTLFDSFLLCMGGFEELLFFNHVTKGTKYFSPNNFKEKIKQMIPHITNQVNFKMPMHPNSVYNIIYTILLDENEIKREDVLLLLETVYNKKKKAPVPKMETKKLSEKYNRAIKDGMVIDEIIK